LEQQMAEYMLFAAPMANRCKASPSKLGAASKPLQQSRSLHATPIISMS
jgi:hypothetical protein